MLAMLSGAESMALPVAALILLVPLVAFCRIVQRLGWHWALGLLTIIPVVNLIMICVFAWGNPPSRNPSVVTGPPQQQS